MASWGSPSDQARHHGGPRHCGLLTQRAVCDFILSVHFSPGPLSVTRLLVFVVCFDVPLKVVLHPAVTAGVRVGASEDADSLDAAPDSSKPLMSVVGFFLHILFKVSFLPPEPHKNTREKAQDVIREEGCSPLRLIESSSDRDLIPLSGWHSRPSPLQVENISNKAPSFGSSRILEMKLKSMPLY